ncbi:MAG: hypothetical protein IPG50_13610 [Myxococcales bacterium]|nr:hypothetical protein [Myxococcales bacterium]
MTTGGLLLRIRAPAFALFVLLLGVYAYFYQAGGWNQNSRFDLVRAVVEERTLVIDRYEKNTGDDSIRNGHYYCDKAPGASLLCIPAYAAVFTLAGAPRPVPPGTLAWGAWLSIVFAIGVPSAIASTFLARAARGLGMRPGESIVLALAWSLASMALPYSTLLYGNQLSASATIVSFALLIELKHGPPRGTSSQRLRLAAVGALLGFAVATEYPAALIGIPVGLYGLHVAGVRAALFAGVGALVPVSLLLAYHAVAFGSPLAFPYDFSVWQTPHTGWFMGIGKPNFVSLRNILVGEYRGLVSTAPWLALAVPGALVLWRSRRAEVLVATAAVYLFLWLNASIPPWDGGWAAGPRYLVPMLPFAALLAGGSIVEISARLAAPERGERAAGLVLSLGLAGLVLYGAANMFAATAVKPEIPTGHKRPYGEFIWPQFRKGQLSVSTQSIDMLDNPPNAPRQAWNLGHKAGLEGHLSLLPLGLWVAVCGAWLAVSLRRERRRSA